MTFPAGTGPQKRLSCESSRLSPSTKKAPSGTRGGRQLIARAIRRWQERIVGAHVVVGVEDAGLALPRLVDEELLVPDRNDVARQTDDPLDEISLRVLRILEDEDISAADWAEREKTLERSSPVRREDELVDEQVVADEDGFLHRGRRHLEGLHEKRPDVEREDHRHAGDLEEIARGGVARRPRRLRR